MSEAVVRPCPRCTCKQTVVNGFGQFGCLPASSQAMSLWRSELEPKLAGVPSRQERSLMTSPKEADPSSSSSQADQHVVLWLDKAEEPSGAAFRVGSGIGRRLRPRLQVRVELPCQPQQKPRRTVTPRVCRSCPVQVEQRGTLKLFNFPPRFADQKRVGVSHAIFLRGLLDGVKLQRLRGRPDAH